MAIFSRSVICFSLVALSSGLAQASSLPAADQAITALQLSTGPSVGLSWSPGPRWQTGLTVAMPFYYFSNFGTLRYGAYSLYQFLELDGFYMAGLIGLYGDFLPARPQQYSPIGLQMGVAMAYRLHRNWSLRLNLVPGVAWVLPPAGSTQEAQSTIGWIVFPPAGGIELAWQVNPNLEMSIGYNGNGDILGMNWEF